MKESASKRSHKKLNLSYAYSNYVKGGGVYIMALIDDEPYADITVNLSAYGITTKINEVMVPTYKLDADVFSSFVDNLAERIITRIGYGPYDAYCDLVELKKDWKDKAIPLEEYYKTAE